MNQKLTAIYGKASVQQAALNANIDSTRLVALFHLVIQGVRHLQSLPIERGNWASAFDQDQM